MLQRFKKKVFNFVFLNTDFLATVKSIKCQWPRRIPTQRQALLPFTYKALLT